MAVYLPSGARVGLFLGDGYISLLRRLAGEDGEFVIRHHLCAAGGFYGARGGIGACVCLRRFALAARRHLWMPIAVVICVFALTDGKALAGVRAMASRPLSYLGSISMEIFLLHVPVIAGMHRLAPHLSFELSYGAALVAAAAITLAISAAVHRMRQWF